MPAMFRARALFKKRNAGLRDLTPSKFACTYTMSCPAVLQDQSDGSYLIIGQACDAAPVNLSQRVGEEEALVRIPGELLEGALSKSGWRNTVQYGMAMAVGASLTCLPQLFSLLQSRLVLLK